MAQFSPVTPRSQRLGRELRKLREAQGWTQDEAAKQIGCSESRVSRIEKGEIKPRPGDVMEFLHTYGVPLDDKQGAELLALARDLRQVSWWQRLDALSTRYATFIAYEAEALAMDNFEPTLIPGLLQTPDYARVINSVRRETDADAIKQRVDARIGRQSVLTRQPVPLKLHAILSEAALMAEVGGPDILRDQLDHIVTLARQPSITVQVLRFAAGAHLASQGGFAILSFGGDQAPLGYVETPAGELFLESAKEIGALTQVYDHLKTLAMSPAESITYIKERARNGT